MRIGRLARPDPDGVVFADATARSGADAVLGELPGGLRTMLSKRFQGGRDLSGGQWQRISVARGLYRAAPVVVADEPTAALDARAEHTVFAALRSMAADGTRPGGARRDHGAGDPPAGQRAHGRPDRRPGARAGHRRRHARRADGPRRASTASCSPCRPAPTPTASHLPRPRVRASRQESVRECRTRGSARPPAGRCAGRRHSRTQILPTRADPADSRGRGGLTSRGAGTRTRPCRRRPRPAPGAAGCCRGRSPAGRRPCRAATPAPGPRRPRRRPRPSARRGCAPQSRRVMRVVLAQVLLVADLEAVVVHHRDQVPDRVQLAVREDVAVDERVGLARGRACGSA